MQLKRAEQLLESAIFNSRWLMAPFYVGLVVTLVVVLFRFIAILYEFIIHAWTAGESEIILGVLSLIDISLIGNLILVIVFAGYENFVSRIDASSHPDWPDWMTKIGFSGTKQKLLASIVAISVIQVLKAFMNLGTTVDNLQLAWLVGIQSRSCSQPSCWCGPTDWAALMASLIERSPIAASAGLRFDRTA